MSIKYCQRTSVVIVIDSHLITDLCINHRDGSLSSVTGISICCSGNGHCELCMRMYLCWELNTVSKTSESITTLTRPFEMLSILNCYDFENWPALRFDWF